MEWNDDRRVRDLARRLQGRAALGGGAADVSCAVDCIENALLEARAAGRAAQASEVEDLRQECERYRQLAEAAEGEHPGTVVVLADVKLHVDGTQVEGRVVVTSSRPERDGEIGLLVLGAIDELVRELGGPDKTTEATIRTTDPRVPRGPRPDWDQEGIG